MNPHVTFCEKTENQDGILSRNGAGGLLPLRVHSRHSHRRPRGDRERGESRDHRALRGRPREALKDPARRLRQDRDADIWETKGHGGGLHLGKVHR